MKVGLVNTEKLPGITSIFHTAKTSRSHYYCAQLGL